MPPLVLGEMLHMRLLPLLVVLELVLALPQLLLRRRSAARRSARRTHMSNLSNSSNSSNSRNHMLRMPPLVLGEMLHMRLLPLLVVLELVLALPQLLLRRRSAARRSARWDQGQESQRGPACALLALLQGPLAARRAALHGEPTLHASMPTLAPPHAPCGRPA